MDDLFIATEIKNSEDEQLERSGLPDSLRRQFSYPDEWIREREAAELENEWLQAERDEVMQYVRILKKLAIYLAGKADINSEKLSSGFFTKAEKNIPEHLQREMEIEAHL
jgi:hypothetical protein